MFGLEWHKKKEKLFGATWFDCTDKKQTNKKKECNGRPFVLTIDKTQFILAKLRIAAL